MNILKNIEFDARCKKTTAVIAGLLGLLIALAIADMAGLSPWLGFIVIFAGDLCACTVLTLYSGMAVYALFPENGKTRQAAFLAADALGEVLKLIFLLLPPVIYGQTIPLPHILALITDIVLSRFILARLLKARG